MSGVGLITVPTTFVWSDKDPVVGLTATLRTADWVESDYELVAMKGIGHWVPEEAPAALAQAALRRIGV
jgi:pimeloyl-ACP methyl ester carboxylesterase